MKTIQGQVDLVVARHVGEALMREHVQNSNTTIRRNVLEYVKYLWGTTTSVTATMFPFPWRPPASFDGQNLNVRAGVAATTHGVAPDGEYPLGLTGAGSDVSMGTFDPLRFRGYNGTAGSRAAADRPLVIGGLVAKTDVFSGAQATAGVMSATEIPVTQIGPVYPHPPNGAGGAAGTCTTTAGAAYISAVAGASVHSVQHGPSVITLTSGADKGVYLAHHWDYTNSRLYLTNLDGTLFSAAATATLVPLVAGGRWPYFNEVGVIANSKGTAATGGIFTPGENRTSYLYRLMYEKSGSPSPADSAQHGSYWLSLRPLLYGAGNVAQSIMFDRDENAVDSSMIRSSLASTHYGWNCPTIQTVGYHTFLALDRANQRLWWITDNLTGGGIGYWLYKSPETFHEIVNTAGTAGDPLVGSPIVLTGSRPRTIDVGSDGTVYTSIVGTNAGFAKIAPDLSAQQILAASVGLPTGVNIGLKVDRSRARAVTGAATTTNNTGYLTIAGGAFTQSDVERVVVLTDAGSDDGTYRVDVVTNATDVTLKNLDGSAKLFVGGVHGAATLTFGDRIYLFFRDAVTNTDKMTFTESLAFGVILTRTVVMTNGRNAFLNDSTVTASSNGIRRGTPAPIDIDQTTGVVYWVSDDVATQVNSYDPTTATWRRRVMSDFNGLNGGAGTTPTNPAYIPVLVVNQHASFPEVWLGFDVGCARLLDKTNIATSVYQRYFGGGTAAEYQKPANFHRPSRVRNAYEATRCISIGPDGRVYKTHGSNTAAAGEFVVYSREADAFVAASLDVSTAPSINEVSTTSNNNEFIVTPYGEVVWVCPSEDLYVGMTSIHYQWIGGAWVAKEVVRGVLPGTDSPGCAAKDLHTALEDLPFGVKVKFTPVGGGVPANEEFIGRVGCVRVSGAADGATYATGSGDQSNFGGSGFVGADVGRYLRIHDGAQAGVYLVSAYVTANKVTLKRLNPGTAWISTGAEAGLTYSLWEQSMVNPGPETASFWGTNGVGKDNMQDLSSIVYEFFYAKTVLSEQAESVKAALQPLGAPGAGSAPTLHLDTLAYGSSYEPALGAHRALGSALTNGAQALDGSQDDVGDGTNGRLTTSFASWRGGPNAAQSGGYHVATDLGAAAEVGKVVVKGRASFARLLTLNAAGGSYSGAMGALYGAADTGTPVASTSDAAFLRTSGAVNLTTNANNSTITVTTGDFLGALVTDGADAVTVVNGNVASAAAGAFTGREGMVLVLTSGTDAGAYRIVSVSLDGSQATIRNLDMTAKSFAASASGLGYEVRDAVREEDLICIPSRAVPTHKLCIDRLLTTTTAQVRLAPTSGGAANSWECLKPSWVPVKRLSVQVDSALPEPTANGTYLANDGKDANDNLDFKVVFDLSDLPVAQRTFRYWRLALWGRSAASNAATLNVNAVEFYDPAGNRLELLPDQRIDTATSQPQFLACHVTRVDWVQASDTAASHVAGVNGLAALGGADGDTVTLAGGNAFLGHEVRAGASSTIAGNTITISGSDPAFLGGSDIGRILRRNGVYYRVATRPSATTVTVTTPAGNSVSVTDATPRAWALHEGVNAGVVTPDYFAFTTGGNGPNVLEIPILSISDDLTTLVLADKRYAALANQNWEIRRRATVSSATATDATKTARILYTSNAAPRQAGDFAQDSRGALLTFSEDMGGTARTGGATTAATGTFTGVFTPDDEGRILVIASGADRGHYRIDAYVNATTATLVDARTGDALSFSGTSGLSYSIVGERRFRIARYVTSLRS